MLPTNLNLVVADAAALRTYRTELRAARKARAGQKPYQCLECGHRLSSTAAVKALDHGCPKCGGSDIDVAQLPTLTTKGTPAGGESGRHHLCAAYAAAHPAPTPLVWDSPIEG